MKIPRVYQNRILLCLLLLFGANILVGCNVTDTLYVIFIAPLVPAPTVKAEYSMADKTVLIWIDDTTVELKHPSLRRELTSEIHTLLEEHQAIDGIVEYAKIARFRTTHPEFVTMSIQELGQRLGAQQVLYLFINQFQFRHEAGAEYYQPVVSGSCKVIDVETGERVWPMEQSYRSFAVNHPLVEGKGPQFEEGQIQSLGAAVAQEIAPYFYKHKINK